MRLTRIMVSHSAMSISCVAHAWSTPAVVTIRSRPPNAAIVSWIASITDSSAPTSVSTSIALPPAATMAATAPAANGPRTSHTATLAPSPARRAAQARPMPLPAPVTKARRPSSRRALLSVTAGSPAASFRSPGAQLGTGPPCPWCRCATSHRPPALVEVPRQALLDPAWVCIDGLTAGATGHRRLVVALDGEVVHIHKVMLPRLLATITRIHKTISSAASIQSRLDARLGQEVAHERPRRHNRSPARTGGRSGR